MPAVMFGSISTVADTSELQRRAFNEAFQAHGLDWEWSREDYLAMLEQSGGQQRIARYAAARGESVDAQAVHATKSSIFQRHLADTDVTPRPGVVDTIRDAKSQGMKIALVTTTSPRNVAALLEALASSVRTGDFDVVVDASDVEQCKPDGAAYAFAVRSLGEQAADCVAIEDNLGGVQAARAAGVTCVAFPNENTVGHDFGQTALVQRVDLDELRSVASLDPGSGLNR